MSRRSRARSVAEEGFTLVELAVAMVVLVILVGIALPTFLGTRAGAADQAAKSVAMIGLKAQRTIYADGRGYGDSDAVEKVEPAVAFAPLPPADGEVPNVLGVVYVRLDDDEVVLVSRSRSGRCYWAKERHTRSSFAENDCTTSPDFATSW
jgi:prepilin-type N-terminal cleavage/methylation domain-containing protein